MVETISFRDSGHGDTPITQVIFGYKKRRLVYRAFFTELGLLANLDFLDGVLLDFAKADG